MQELINNAYKYALVDNDQKSFKYDFISTGISEVPKRVNIRQISQDYPQFYNLGFGDISISANGEELVEDKNRNSNITDGNKILSTAFLCAIDFLTNVDDATVIFFGNTPLKHRLYRMRICGCLNSLTEFISVKGAIIPNYKVPLDNDGFKKITESIDPETIYYEQFDPNNCSSYSFMTFILNKKTLIIIFVILKIVRKMKQLLKNLIEKSGKRAEVSYADQKRRKKFDENFGKEKLDMINTALGEKDNKRLIFKKLAE